MKPLTLTLAMAVLFTAGTALAVDFDTDGATAGKWTMDLEAAQKLAAEKDLPLMVNFSGSDWCGWCKIMEKNVFALEAWAEYASSSLVMVLIDFPKDEEVVPEKYKERNDALKGQYGVRGFPTFIILDSDGKTELGRLSAGREKTPESVQGELGDLFRYRDAEVQKYAKTLGDKGDAYLAIVGQLSSAKGEVAEHKEAIAAANTRIEALGETIDSHLAAARDFRAEQLGAEAFKAYQDIKKEHDAAQADLESWMASGPERNAESQKVFSEKSGRVSAAAAQLASY